MRIALDLRNNKGVDLGEILRSFGCEIIHDTEMLRANRPTGDEDCSFPKALLIHHVQFPENWSCKMTNHSQIFILTDAEKGRRILLLQEDGFYSIGSWEA